MNPDGATPPQYDLAVVAQAILEMIAELHPEHLAVSELLLRIVADPNDEREIETAIQAIAGLKQFDLVHDRDDDEVVEPTLAALRAHSLLA